MQARNWPDAIRIYESLRQRLGDRDATILNNLAWAYAERDDYEAAIPIARRAWSLDPANPAATDTLGWILFKSGSNRAEALALLERARRGAPSDADIRRRLEQARRS
jgi:tetratricopeptide (TPR) repeat protein